jgi:hypothetical protein
MIEEGKKVKKEKQRKGKMKRNAARNSKVMQNAPFDMQPTP